MLLIQSASKDTSSKKFFFSQIITEKFDDLLLLR